MCIPAETALGNAYKGEATPTPDLQPSEDKTAKTKDLSLPPNLESGLEVSIPVLLLGAFRPSLFDFVLSDATKVATYECSGGDGRASEYPVLNYLHFVWASSSGHFTVAGRTKNFSKELSMKMHLIS
ncbi:hypothetical protein BDZ45DRAFT_693071 [Acephala macrosclerotiorum]|nr:hypothetical protein BDZ45DRAFT_693071 [Acephala macrosclerotiorum]